MSVVSYNELARALQAINRSRAKGTVLVAARSFSYIDRSGRLQHIKSGETFVDSNTEDAQRFPTSFKPANGRGVSPPTQRARQTFTPAFQVEAKLEPPTDVTMTWKVRRSLQEEAARMGNRLEAGGFLFGQIEPHVLGLTTRVQIQRFSHCRLDDKRTASTFDVSSDHLEEALQDPTCIGDWHTHPSIRSLTPSEKDIGAWGGRADRVSWRRGRAPGYIGLIISSEDGAWVSWGMRLSAWFAPPLRYDVPPAEREPKPIPIREVG